jgi:hypothetical protein
MEDTFARMWENLIGRIGGPLSFRLIIQPMVAVFFAVRAGWNDAKKGRVPYGWKIISNPVKRRELLREGWKDIAKVFVAACVIDLIYQIIELQWLHPEEALIVAAMLALLPYLLLRGLANRVSRKLWHARELR